MFFFIMVSSFHLFGVVVLHVWCIPASQVETSVWAKVCVCGWHGTVQYEVSKINTFWQLFHLNNCTLRASKPLRASCKEGIAGFGGAWLQTGMSKTRKPCPLRKCQIINKRTFMRIKKSARGWKLDLALPPTRNPMRPTQHCVCPVTYTKPASTLFSISQAASSKAMGS